MVKPLPFVQLIIGILIFILSLIVYSLRDKKNLCHLLFTELLLYISGWVITGSIMEFQIAKGANPIYASRISMAFASLIAPSLILFSMSFPDKTSKLPALYNLGLRLIGIASAILALSGLYIKEFKIIHGIAYRELSPFILIFSILFISSIFLSFYFLIYKYSRLTSVQKIKTLYVVTAFIVGFSLGTIFSLILPLLGQDQLFSLGYLGPFFIALLVSYALIKKRLMDISLVIKKTTAYSLVTSAITFSYVLVVIAFEFLFRSLYGYYSFWASIPAALVIAVTFVPLRERFQDITDRIFFRRIIEYQNVIKEVTRLVVSVTDLTTLFRLIDRTIVRAMCVKNVAVLLLEEKEDRFLVEKTNGLPESVLAIKLPPASPLVAYLTEKKDAVVLDEIFSLLKSELTSAQEKKRLKMVCGELQKLGAIVAIPSFTKDKLVGILCLGEKLSGESYSPDDLELLLTMASEAGIAIENAKLYRDITETRDYLNSLVQGSDDAIITADLNGAVLSWNDGAKVIFGYDLSDIIGKIPPFFSESEIKQLINKVLSAEEVKAVEIRKNNKAGKEIPLLLTLSPIRDPAGAIIGLSAILKDITELRKVDQLKREFLSVVSHELRTPLTPIKGYLALLLSGQFGEMKPKQKEALTVILDQSNHLHDLIDSVIDISRIEAGRPLELEKEPVFIDEIIRKSVEAARPAFETKEINIQTSYPPVRLSLMADGKKLMRVVDNLLGNAFKFTPAGGSVKATLEKKDRQIRIVIADSGIGLNPQHREKIFERFFQVDTSYTRASGGIGMGLTIAREIIEAHGGRIWAESEGSGKGSKLAFVLPLE